MHLLGQTIDVAANARRPLIEHRTFVWLLLATAVLDALTTIGFMSVWGPAREHNWLVRELSYALGILAGPPLGKLFQLAAAWGLMILVPRLSRFICLVVIALNLFACVVNVRVQFSPPLSPVASAGISR